MAAKPGRSMMTKTFGARWQNEPGELALKLAELERRRDEGTAEEGRILALLAEVRQLADQVDLEPWRARADQGVVGAVVCWGAWDLMAITLPDLTDRMGLGMDLALGLGCLALCYALWSHLIYVRRHQANQAWFGGLEDTIRRGGKIVDYLRQAPASRSERVASGF